MQKPVAFSAVAELLLLVAAAAAVAAVVRVVGRMVLGSRPDSSGEYLKVRKWGRGGEMSLVPYRQIGCSS